MMRQGASVLWALLVLGTAAGAFGQELESMETCAACHEDEAAAFAAGPHGALMGEELDGSCAVCHGPVELHLEEFTAESIERWPTPAACLTCHAGSRSLDLATPGHRRHDVACLDCHVSGHGEAPALPLLAAETTTLCGSCHGEQKSAFARPFTHREGSDVLGCESCHSVHGGGEPGRLSLLGNGGACISCHTDKAGPFIFPHAPREVDGCVTCHEPHGSANPRQLIRRTVLSLCLECHSNVPLTSFHDFSRPRFRACQSCHRAVHGSNSDARLLDE